MAVPVSTNTTCDIYRSANGPPNPPDVAGVKVFLAPKGSNSLTAQYYSHVALVAQGTDIRDDYTTGSFTTPGSGADHLYVPDQSGAQYIVVLVRRVGRGTAIDHLQVLLKRKVTAWPTQNL